MSVDLVLSRLKGVKKQSEVQWTALCPSHEDHQQSLSVGVGHDGRVLLRCFVGCEFESIRKSLNVPIEMLFVTNEITKSSPPKAITVEDIAQHKEANRAVDNR